MERLEFVQQMIAKLRNFFLTTDPVIAIGVDGGGSSTYDRKGAYEMLKELELEERRLGMKWDTAEMRDYMDDAEAFRVSVIRLPGKNPMSAVNLCLDMVPARRF